MWSEYVSAGASEGNMPTHENWNLQVVFENNTSSGRQNLWAYGDDHEYSLRLIFWCLIDWIRLWNQTQTDTLREQQLNNPAVVTRSENFLSSLSSGVCCWRLSDEHHITTSYSNVSNNSVTLTGSLNNDENFSDSELYLKFYFNLQT